MTAEATAQANVSVEIANIIAERADHVFGLMGNGNAHLISHLTRNNLPFTAVRHEAATVAAADAYYRASGAIATATTTYGAGFTNTLTALSEASVARIPLVLVVGDAPTEPRFFDIDQTATASSMKVETLTVSIDDAAAQTHRAFDIAVTHKRPVVLAIPYDVSTSTGTGFPAEPAESAATTGLPLETREQLVQVGKVLATATRPLILAGRGVVESATAELVKKLGDATEAVFFNTLMATNVIDSPYSLGIAGGFTRNHVAELAAQADVVLALGAGLNQFTRRHGQLFTPENIDQTVIRIDENPLVPLEGAVEVRADLAEALPVVLEAAQHTEQDRTEDSLRVQVPEDLDNFLFGAPEKYQEFGAEFAADGRLNPRAVIHRLNELLPANRGVVQDGGHFLGWAPGHLKLPDPAALVCTGTAFQAIGLGLGSAVGFIAANAEHAPGRLNVVVSGDGGGLMALADLESVIRTTRERGEQSVIIFINDAAYGAEIHQYHVHGLDDAAMRIDEVNFAAVGAALGATGINVASMADLGQLGQWLDAGEPGTAVVNIRVSELVVADYMRQVMS